MAQTKKKQQANIFLIAGIALGLVLIASLGSRVYLADKAQASKQTQDDYRALSFYKFDQPRVLNDVSLSNLEGIEKPFLSHREGWRLVNFGYLSCPDICPINLALLNHLKNDWDADKNLPSLDVIHITFDPERDKPDVLKRYLHFMNPDFYGLTGEVDNIKKLSQQLNLVFIHEQPNERGDYFISHSDSMAVLNPKGEYVGLFKGPYDIVKMIQALKRLVNESSES